MRRAGSLTTLRRNRLSNSMGWYRVLFKLAAAFLYSGIRYRIIFNWNKQNFNKQIFFPEARPPIQTTTDLGAETQCHSERLLLQTFPGAETSVRPAGYHQPHRSERSRGTVGESAEGCRGGDERPQCFLRALWFSPRVSEDEVGPAGYIDGQVVSISGAVQLLPEL